MLSGYYWLRSGKPHGVPGIDVGLATRREIGIWPFLSCCFLIKNRITKDQRGNSRGWAQALQKEVLILFKVWFLEYCSELFLNTGGCALFKKITPPQKSLLLGYGDHMGYQGSKLKGKYPSCWTIIPAPMNEEFLPGFHSGSLVSEMLVVAYCHLIGWLGLEDSFSEWSTLGAFDKTSLLLHA